MTILIVEDDENKGNHLSLFLGKEFPDAVVTIERSLQSGLRSVKASTPDLVILDMSLPRFDIGPEEPGGKSYTFGGRQFLKRLDRQQIRVPVIVVTQFDYFPVGDRTLDLDDLDQELKTEHSINYRGAVYYNTAVEGWKQQLSALVNATVK